MTVLIGEELYNLKSDVITDDKTLTFKLYSKDFDRAIFSTPPIKNTIKVFDEQGKEIAVYTQYPYNVGFVRNNVTNDVIATFYKNKDNAHSAYVAFSSGMIS